ncbi:alginate O-acetyltransferase AlgX-related protein [Methylomonas sp. MED-D]|uniref:alginate O-acetyltransferase AlgX-related protein n=1 Tax=unclassified Methylomonas TaxID=2608980 RepID=UPI0028A2DFB3|nr:hypothetical protein [Methylomonas sp. MV1]MDT4328975.1 hypothetical protein [Methylomonas sp. MV1]
MHRVRFFILPILFFGAISTNTLLTSLGYVLPSKLDENRQLASMPKYSGSIETFIRQLDSFVSDNFAFRKPLVEAYNSLLYRVFNSTFNNKVIIGRDGWIFGADFDTQHSLAPRTLSDEYKRNVRISLIERRDWLAERGINLVIMFMPSKLSIYGPNYLPSALRFSKEQATESEQVYDFLSRDSGIQFIPVKKAILEKSSAIQTYYPTDGHANHQGTFAAFNSLIYQLRLNFPNEAPSEYPPSELKDDYLEPTSYGRLMGVPFKDLSWVSVPLAGYRQRERLAPQFAELAPVGVRARYLTNDQAPFVKTVLIGDSFTNRLAAYIGEVFRETDVFNLNNVAPTPELKFPIEYLDKVRPKFLIMTWVESRLVECLRPCQDAFPVENPAAVRQARLRRLFLEFSVSKSDWQGPRNGAVLAELRNPGQEAIKVRVNGRSDVLKGEMTEIVIPAMDKAYLFLDTDSKGNITPPIIEGNSSIKPLQESVLIPLSAL